MTIGIYCVTYPGNKDNVNIETEIKRLIMAFTFLFNFTSMFLILGKYEL